MIEFEMYSVMKTYMTPSSLFVDGLWSYKLKDMIDFCPNEARRRVKRRIRKELQSPSEPRTDVCKKLDEFVPSRKMGVLQNMEEFRKTAKLLDVNFKDPPPDLYSFESFVEVTEYKRGGFFFRRLFDTDKYTDLVEKYADGGDMSPITRYYEKCLPPFLRSMIEEGVKNRCGPGAPEAKDALDSFWKLEEFARRCQHFGSFREWEYRWLSQERGNPESSVPAEAESLPKRGFSSTKGKRPRSHGRDAESWEASEDVLRKRSKKDQDKTKRDSTKTCAQMGNHSTEFNSKSRERVDVSQNEFDILRRYGPEGACCYCGRSGHIARTCKAPLEQQEEHVERILRGCFFLRAFRAACKRHSNGLTNK